jgi:hypothetical protein
MKYVFNIAIFSVLLSGCIPTPYGIITPLTPVTGAYKSIRYNIEAAPYRRAYLQHEADVHAYDREITRYQTGEGDHLDERNQFRMFLLVARQDAEFKRRYKEWDWFAKETLINEPIADGPTHSARDF